MVYPCYAAMVLLRFCGSAPVSLCGFCPADAACHSLPMSLYLLIFLWFRYFWGLILANVSMVRMCSCVLTMKYLMRVATVGNCSVWQHICVSSTACGHPDLAGGSCFQSGGAATFAALLVASFVFVLLFVAQELAGVHSFCDVDALNMFYVMDGLCTLANVYWCVEGVSIIYRSCGSCICLIASCSSSCGSVGILSFLEGDISFLDGVLACAVVAHCLFGVFNIFCGCSSCTVLGLLSKHLQCVCWCSLCL